MILFVSLALVEYWVAPLFLGISDYAGIWSSIGYVLFAALIAALIAFVLVPLRRPLARAFEARGTQWRFHALWGGALVLGLFATSSFQLAVSGSSDPSAVAPIGATTVYSPFGAWPSLTFSVPWAHLDGSLNPAIVTLLAILAVLWASVVAIGLAQRAARCEPVPSDEPRWRTRLRALAVWGPFGFISGCSSCPPAYFAVIAAVAPGTASAGASAIPLVPWIGFAGLLYLASLGLTLAMLRRATTPGTANGISIATGN